MFQVDRKIFKNPIWNNLAEFRIFLYILGNAVWSEEGVQYGNILVKRGQYLRSYRNLREDLMYMENNAVKYYSISHIKKVTDKLVNDGRLEKKETKLGTLFTIVNYSKYQWLQGTKSDNQERRKNSVRTEQEQNENNKNKDNKDNKDNNNISLQISNLRERYSEEQLKVIDEYFDILRWTRKNGKIADSVIVKIYKKWEEFKVDKVIYSLNVYINNPKYHDKKENYCYGIMRNTKDEEVYGGGSGGKYKGNGNREVQKAERTGVDLSHIGFKGTGEIDESDVF